MALIALQEAHEGNQSVSFAAANGGGDTVASGFRSGGHDLPVVLLVRNTDAAPKTVTVQGVGYIVPATTGFAVIPVKNSGQVAPVPVTYSAVTNVTVAAVRLYKR